MQGKFSFKETGRRLAQIRHEMGLNQLEFAKVVGVSPGSIKNYERGFTEPSASFLLLLLEKFDINPTWLVSGRQNPKYSAVIKTADEVRKKIDVFTLSLSKQAAEKYKGELFYLMLSFTMENEGKVDEEKFMRLLEIAHHAK